MPAADPAPLGLAAFALTTFLLSGHNASFIPDVDLGRAGPLLRRAASCWPGCGSSATATCSARRRSRRTAGSGSALGIFVVLVDVSKLRRRARGREPDERARVVPARVRDLQHVHAAPEHAGQRRGVPRLPDAGDHRDPARDRLLQPRARRHRWWLHAGGWVGIVTAAVAWYTPQPESSTACRARPVLPVGAGGPLPIGRESARRCRGERGVARWRPKTATAARDRDDAPGGAAYPPPAEFAAQANAQPDIYDEDFEEFWEREGRERLTGSSRSRSSTSGSRRTPSGTSAASSTSASTASTATSRPATATRSRSTGRASREDERRDDHLRRPPARGRPFANALKKLGVKKGTAGRDLHGHGPGAAGRDARVHAHRRAAHRRVRRLLGRLALGPHERHGLRGADHAGRGVAARHDGAVEADGGRGDGRRARRQARPSSSAGPATTSRCRTAATSGGTTRRAASDVRHVPAPSRWTARTCCS